MYIKIIARISKGIFDTGYRVIMDDGSVTNVGKDYIANWAARGIVVNALVDNGNIVINDYDDLPVFIMNSMGQLRADSKNRGVIVAQIVEKGVVIGYRVQLPSWQLKSYDKQSVIDLIKNTGVKFANKLKVSKGNIIFNEPIFSMTMDGVGIPYTMKTSVNVNNSKVTDKKAQHTSNFDIKDGKLLKVRDGALENGVLKIPEGVTEIGKDAVFDLDISVLILPKSLKKLDADADNVFNYVNLKSVKGSKKFIDIFYNPHLTYFNNFIVIADGCCFLKDDYGRAEFLLSKTLDYNAPKVKSWCDDAGVDYDYSEHDRQIEVYNEEELIKYLLFEYYQELTSNDIRRRAKDIGLFEFEVI